MKPIETPTLPADDHRVAWQYNVYVNAVEATYKTYRNLNGPVWAHE